MTNSFMRRPDGTWSKEEPVVHGVRDRLVRFFEEHNLHKLATLIELTR